MLDNNSIRKFLIKNYSFIGRNLEIKQLKHNYRNSINYKILTKTNSYVLRKFLDRSSPIKIEKICKILEICRKKNVKVLEPIKNTKGYYVDKKNCIFLTKYYSGHLYKNSKEDFDDFSKNVAILHNTLLKNSISFNYKPFKKEHKILTINEIENIRSKIKCKKKYEDFDYKIIKDFDFLLKVFGDWQKTSKSFDSLKFKKQLIHNDLQPGNVIFNRGKVNAIIDFNGMSKGYKIEDIAFASFRFSVFSTNNLLIINKKIERFLKNYAKYSNIEQEQLDSFHLFLTRKILIGISRILRLKYFCNSDLWIIDYEKSMKFLRISNKLALKPQF